MVLDPQLLHCIHRNAVSNACKYGAPNGEVVTRLKLRLLSREESLLPANDDGSEDATDRYELTLEVANEPGPRHSKLTTMEQKAVRDKVFSQGSRLHPELVSSVSSGDGGWIMRKCAKTLGGDCDIHFNTHGTVFTMSCPTSRPLGRSSSDVEFYVGAVFEECG